jgi:hypothetical protein
LADGIAITAGSGTTVATDDVGGSHYQVVKIGLGLNNAVDTHLDSGQQAMSASVPVAIASDQTAISVTSSPATSGGYSNSHLVAAGSTNATSVKASAGQLYVVSVLNLAAAPRYLKFHNTAGAPSAGTGVVYTVAVQAGVERTITFPHGLAFSTGIAFTTVTGVADANTDAVTASDLVIDVSYK